MPRIDFYILGERHRGNREQMACRLVEKARESKQQVWIRCASEEHARTMDGLLWTHRDSSFIPHACMPVTENPLPPVLIGWNHEPTGPVDVLINLDQPIPPQLDQFDRVIEIVDNEHKQAARERFQHYREQGYSPDSHTIDT